MTEFSKNLLILSVFGSIFALASWFGWYLKALKKREEDLQESHQRFKAEEERKIKEYVSPPKWKQKPDPIGDQWAREQERALDLKPYRHHVVDEQFVLAPQGEPIFEKNETLEKFLKEETESLAWNGSHAPTPPPTKKRDSEPDKS